MRTARWMTAPVIAGALVLGSAVPAHASDERPVAGVDAVRESAKKTAAARDRVASLSEEATRLAKAAVEARAAAAVASEAAFASQQEATEASAQVRVARSRLGEYIAGAYITGAAPATLSATLNAANPSELVARQNSLASVADNTVDLVAAIREGEAVASERFSAAAVLKLEAVARSRDAAGLAREADSAVNAAADLLEELVAQDRELRAKLGEDVLRARADAYAAGAGADTVGTDHIPLSLREFGNGAIPKSALREVGDTGHYMWGPAAIALEQMLAAAAADGHAIGITDSYRPLNVQKSLVAKKGLYTAGGLAAAPGTSRHGWGLATDLALSSGALDWIRANGAAYNFVEDTPRESWHWQYYATGEFEALFAAERADGRDK